MAREIPEWQYFEIVEVELGDGSIGHGETMLYYTWARTAGTTIDEVIGQDAFDVLWDDSIGAGLQMALFDAIGRALNIPAYQLLGEQIRDRVPVSWWAIDMPAEDWVKECTRAMKQGYTEIKLKARPWFDIRRQLRHLTDTLPPSFDVGLDFNKTLVDADRAIPLLQELEGYPPVSTFEEPIPQEYVEQNRQIHDSVSTDTAHHYGYTPRFGALKANVCDGYVLTGGASEILADGAVLHTANRPCWLQLVGTGITATFCAHLGAVVDEATWPAINCNNIYADSLLEDDFEVRDGHTMVPDTPGLGYEVDLGAVETFAIERPDTKPVPPRLIEVTWPDNPTMYFADGEQLKTAAKEGRLPYFEEGVDTRLIPDDGSQRWAELHTNALESPVVDS